MAVLESREPSSSEAQTHHAGSFRHSGSDRSYEGVDGSGPSLAHKGIMQIQDALAQIMGLSRYKSQRFSASKYVPWGPWAMDALHFWPICTQPQCCITHATYLAS